MQHKTREGTEHQHFQLTQIAEQTKSQYFQLTQNANSRTDKIPIFPVNINPNSDLFSQHNLRTVQSKAS